MRQSFYLLTCLLFVSALTRGQGSIQKGVTLYQSKKLDDAAMEFKAIKNSSGDYSAAQYYLGRIAYERKEFDDAVDYFKAATEKSPANDNYFNWLGDAYSAVGSKASIFTQMSVGPKALRAWEKAAQLSPKNINARVSLVDSYIVAPEFMGGGDSRAKTVAKEVLPLLEESIKTNPGNFLHQYWYGKVAALTGVNLEQGEVLLLSYLKYTPTQDEPSHAGAYMRLGQIKEKQGNRVEAKRHYESALKLDHKLEGAKKGLERVSK